MKEIIFLLHAGNSYLWPSECSSMWYWCSLHTDFNRSNSWLCPMWQKWTASPWTFQSMFRFVSFRFISLRLLVVTDICMGLKGGFTNTVNLPRDNGCTDLSLTTSELNLDVQPNCPPGQVKGSTTPESMYGHCFGTLLGLIFFSHMTVTCINFAGSIQLVLKQGSQTLQTTVVNGPRWVYMCTMCINVAAIVYGNAERWYLSLCVCVSQQLLTSFARPATATVTAVPKWTKQSTCTYLENSQNFHAFKKPQRNTFCKWQ